MKMERGARVGVIVPLFNPKNRVLNIFTKEVYFDYFEKLLIHTVIGVVGVIFPLYNPKNRVLNIFAERSSLQSSWKVTNIRFKLSLASACLAGLTFSKLIKYIFIQTVSKSTTYYSLSKHFVGHTINKYFNLHQI